MINSRKTEDLHLEVMSKAIKLEVLCLQNGIEIIITSTYRDIESQNALYAIGRTKMGANPTKAKPMGQTVTNAKGGQSYHNFKVAFDVVPVVHGKAIWNNNKVWQQVGKLGTELGLEWGGNFKSIKDMPHFQYTKGLTLAEFQAGKDKGLFND